MSKGKDPAWVILSGGPVRLPVLGVNLNPGLSFQLADSKTAFLSLHLEGTDSRGLKMDEFADQVYLVHFLCL